MDQAQPTIKLATTTDLQKVDVAHSTTASMAKSPLWATSPDVQAAAKAWGLSADDLGANAKVIADLRNQLKAAEAKQLALRRNWRACKRQVLSTVSLVCAGSADDVKGFSLEVITHGTASLLAAPDGIAGSPGATVGAVTVRPRGSGRAVARSTGSSCSTRPTSPTWRGTRRSLPAPRPGTRSARSRRGPTCPSGSRRWIRTLRRR